MARKLRFLWLLVASLVCALGCNMSSSTNSKSASGTGATVAGDPSAASSHATPPSQRASRPYGIDLNVALIALQHYDHEDFRTIMRQLHEDFPQIEPTTVDAPIQWTTLSLNEHGERLGAVRFTSPLQQPADARWCFVLPANVLHQWSLIELDEEADETFEEAGQFVPEYFVDFDDLDEPASNCALFQRVDGGRIDPFQEYILWFAFATDEPVTMSISLRMLPASNQSAESASSAAIARELGLAVPLRFKQPETAAEFAARANATGVQDPAIGISWAEKGLQKWPDDRDLLRTMVSLYERRSFQLVRAGEVSLASPYFRKAAAYAQAFAKQVSDPTADERKLIGNAFYNQACSHGMSGETEVALAALHSAVDMGFANLNLLETDPDLAAVRTGDEFTELVENLHGLLNPPYPLDYELQAHPNDAIEFDGHWYKLYETPLPWHFAQLRCKQEGGYLACLETAEEAAFLQERWPEGELWLGGVAVNFGEWRWLNGQPFTALRWAPNEPKTDSEEPLRLKLGPDGPWFAVPITEKSIRGYVLEWER